MKIPFNKPYTTGKETDYILEAVKSGKISGDGIFTKKVQSFLETKYNFRKCLLTTSCTDALEMAAILIDIKPGDEIIVPSFTFVSTANAFVLRGAKIVFCDSRIDHPGIDEELIEPLITVKTKAIVVVHYAGVASDMSKIMTIAEKYNIYVIEDAAHAIDSFYLHPDGKLKPLGSIGHLAAFSFHETKNIISGEGGMLVINDERFLERSDIIREKGTNRTKFFRGEVDKYSWVDIGSSFLPSDIIAAFLYAQFENIAMIQEQRKKIWNSYYLGLESLHNNGAFKLPYIPDYATNNAHMFYLVCNSLKDRSSIIDVLKKQDIVAVFHYLSLNDSPYYFYEKDNRKFPNADKYSNQLLRLPFYFELESYNIEKIIGIIDAFYK